MVSRMNRRARMALLAGLGLAGLAATGLITQRRAPDIVGPAQVIDGDSIRVAGIEIRLYGIDAPFERAWDPLPLWKWWRLSPANGFEPACGAFPIRAMAKVKPSTRLSRI